MAGGGFQTSEEFALVDLIEGLNPKGLLRKNYSEGDGGFYSKQQWIWSCIRQGRESELIEPDGRPMAPWKAWVVDHNSWKLWEWTTSRMKSGETENEQARML